MNYIYNIYLNFNKIYYDFYEWNDNDNIENIKKIPILKISTKDFKNIVSNNIKISDNLYNQLKNKTETMNNNMTSIIFTDSKNISAIKFNNNKISTKISSFVLEDEYSILEKSKKLKEVKIEYKILNKKIYLTTTRKENNKKKYILNNIKKLSIDTLIYIYFDCYNKEENNTKIIINNILKEINNNNINICDKIYKILKPISTS